MWLFLFHIITVVHHFSACVTGENQAFSTILFLSFIVTKYSLYILMLSTTVAVSVKAFV